MCSQVLIPFYTPTTLTMTCTIVGNFAAHDECRMQFRSLGGIGALVRLLKSDLLTNVRVAAASALALLVPRDEVIQESVRFLGGIDDLVDMLNGHESHVADVASVCLQVSMTPAAG